MLDGQSVVTKRVSCATFFVVGLLCDFSFVSSPHSIQRADPMVQVDYVLVVDWDTGASKTDNQFCASPRGTACCRTRTGLFGSGFDSLSRYAFSLFRTPTYDLLRFGSSVCRRNERLWNDRCWPAKLTLAKHR